MLDVQIAVREYGSPRPEGLLGDAAAACDHVDGEDVVGDEPVALAGQSGSELVDAPAAPGRQRRVVQLPDGKRHAIVAGKNDFDLIHVRHPRLTVTR